MKCNNCGFSGDQDFIFCPTCGAKYIANKKKLTKTKAKGSNVEKKQPEVQKDAKNNNNRVFIIIALIALGVLTIFGLIQLTKGSSDNILLLLPKSAAKSDIVLLKSGDPLEKGIKLLKGIITAKGTINNIDKFPQGGLLLSKPGSFSLDGKSVYLTYQLDTDQYLDQFNVQSKEGKTLYDSGYTFNSVILPNSQNILIKETRTTSCEILFSANGNEAKRLWKGKTCSFSTDGSTMLITESDSTGIISLSVAKVADPEKIVEILSQEKGILTNNLSADGSLLYISKGSLNAAKQIVLYDTTTGDKLVESKEFAYKYASKFSAKGHGFYLITEDVKGNVDLSIFDGKGLSSIKSGRSVNALFNEEGTHLAYVIGVETSSQTAYLYDLQAQTEKEILNGKNMGLTFLSNPQRLLIGEVVDGEAIIFSSDLQSGSVIEIFDQAGYIVKDVINPEGQNKAFIIVSKGGNNSLFTTSLDKEDGYFLIEDFQSITPLTISKDGNWLIFSGKEDISIKTQTLFKVELKKDAEPEELDDEGTSYVNAVFSADEKSLLYTMKTGLDRTESVVRSVVLKEGSKPVVLYEEALIQDISWGILYPWGNSLETTQTISGMSVCPDPKELTITPQQVESKIEANQSDCFMLNLTAGLPVSFHTTNSAGVYVVMNLMDRAGLNYATGRPYIESGSIVDTVKSLVYTPTKTGIFYLRNSATQSVSYRLDVNVRKNSFSTAMPIVSGQTLTGSIGKDDYFIDRNSTAGSIEGYGVAFSFNGQTGQKATINLAGDTSDPDLNPQISIYSLLKKSLSTGQFTNNQDGSLTFDLPTTGKYYILFKSDNTRYGNDQTQSFGFKITLKLE